MVAAANRRVKGMTFRKKPAPKILMIMNGPPWSEWTMSGVSAGLCRELLRRGLLYGAISPRCKSSRYFKSPGPFIKLAEKIDQLISGSSKPRLESWASEDSPIIREYLSDLPPETPVIYTYLNPEYQKKYNIRRFRWIGISILDAMKHGSYGYTGLSQEKAHEKFLKQQETIDQSEAIFTHSSYGADSIARDFKYPREKIFPIGAGASLQFNGDTNITIDRYHRANILFVGRDWERKGGPLVYEAFKLLKSRMPHATLTIVGPSQPPVYGEGIIFEGFLRKHKYFERRRLMRLFRRASVFCTPSVCETWGLVYVEAAASGLPIIGTDEWAMPDIVVNGVTGVLCKDRAPESLSNAMFDILNDPAAAQLMASNAIKHVDQVLDWPNVVDRIIAAISPDSLNGRYPNWLPQDINRNWPEVK